MVDPNFCVRLDALRHDLKVCEHTSAWHRLQIEDMYINTDVKVQLDAPIRKRAKKLVERLDKVSEKLEAINKGDLNTDQICNDAWREYALVYNESQAVFQESMELIGGLILRDRKLDRGICQVADELIITCSLQIRQTARLTIPASQEALRATLGRIIRFRFPEWTYWTLPFIAHEYGHVVMDEQPDMKVFVSEEIDAMVAKQESIAKLTGTTLSETEKMRITKRTEHHVEELLADAFAVYTMGPSYGCATILHRFNYYSAYDEDDVHPSDAKRAWVVLDVLRRMNKDTAGGDFTEVIDHLQLEWDRILYLEPNRHLVAEDVEYLQYLVGKAWDIFNEEFDLALYPTQQVIQGWKIAKAWAEQWNTDLINKKKPTRPKISIHSKIRDALNAAWYCRILYQKRVTSKDQAGGYAIQALSSTSTMREISDASEDLCHAIVIKKSKDAKRLIRAVKEIRNAPQ